jgi:AraC-like DNA-binding protein
VKNYFLYLPDAPAPAPWQCTVTSVGCERVPPNSPYPPRHHPIDHHFDWEKGRILSAYQLVYLTEGRGRFESDPSPKAQRVEAGSVMVLFPGVWHRYAPDPQTGWAEQWIECRGAAFDRAVQAGLLSPQRPVWRVGLLSDWLQGFERCHALAHRRAPGVQALLSTMGLHLLSVLLSAPSPAHQAQRSTDEKVRQAQALLAHRYHERSLTVERLAEEVHVSYSSLRQAFKARTGLSPKQYQLQIRLQKAQDFLANTPKPVGEIAELLGFDSAFHFSKQFKDRVGLAPQAWRKRLAERPRPKRATSERGPGVNGRGVGRL